MASRPSSAAAAASGASSSGGNQQRKPIQGALRPQSAALLLDSPSRQALAQPLGSRPTPGINGGKGKVGASSEDLVRDLEHKVRRVVEQKRSESDKLRFALAKKREEVERAKLILQGLIKESEALGLHYVAGCDNQGEEPSVLPGRGTRHMDEENSGCDRDAPIVEEPGRLQPIASISRRPVYSKHSNINELEAKLEKRASEMHQVHRRTLVLEHIKKRLLTERLDMGRETDELKAQFAAVTHETQELHKKDIIAAEAVSQVQARLVQQKEEIVANERKYMREVAMRQKWAREKAKFEKYYNDQLTAIELKLNQPSLNLKALDVPVTSSEAPSRRHTLRGGVDALRVVLKWTVCTDKHLVILTPIAGSPTRRKSVVTPDPADDEQEAVYREAFLRIGFGQHVDRVDPEEIIRVCLSHEKLKSELDTKHDLEAERVAQLRKTITKLKGVAMEHNQLSKRGTSQKLESKELEISSVERSLATVIDQYMFVDQSVRPIKIGLQQILQNVTNKAVDIDDMNSLEKALLGSCEEMMRLIRESSGAEFDGDSGDVDGDHDDSDDDDDDDNNSSDEEAGLHTERASRTISNGRKEKMSITPEDFTSPFNIRVPLKQREEYFVPGINYDPAPKADERETEEADFDVMDRAMIKRISSVLVCTSSGKKPKDKAAHFNG